MCLCLPNIDMCTARTSYLLIEVNRERHRENERMSNTLSTLLTFNCTCCVDKRSWNRIRFCNDTDCRCRCRKRTTSNRTSDQLCNYQWHRTIKSQISRKMNRCNRDPRTKNRTSDYERSGVDIEWFSLNPNLVLEFVNLYRLTLGRCLSAVRQFFILLLVSLLLAFSAFTALIVTVWRKASSRDWRAAQNRMMKNRKEQNLIRLMQPSTKIAIERKWFACLLTSWGADGSGQMRCVALLQLFTWCVM